MNSYTQYVDRHGLSDVTLLAIGFGYDGAAARSPHATAKPSSVFVPTPRGASGTCSHAPQRMPRVAPATPTLAERAACLSAVKSKLLQEMAAAAGGASCFGFVPDGAHHCAWTDAQRTTPPLPSPSAHPRIGAPFRDLLGAFIAPHFHIMPSPPLAAPSQCVREGRS